MYIVNPFFTIFNENNWFLNKETGMFYYSDYLLTTNEDLYIDIPFKKNNIAYNTKINSFFNKFCNVLLNKVENNRHKKLLYKPINITEDLNHLIIKLQPINISEFAIEFKFSIINHQ